MVRSARLVAGAGLVVLAAAGCSSTGLHVKKSDVEGQVRTQFAAKVGQPPSAVSCSGDLAAKVGTTEHCTLGFLGQSYGVTITVTSVQGKTVNFDITLDTPLQVPSSSATDTGASSPTTSSSS